MTNTSDMREAERLAREFHKIYEELAPSYGYETKVDTRNFDPSTPNGRLMISTCQKLIEQWQSQQAQGEAAVNPEPWKDGWTEWWEGSDGWTHVKTNVLNRRLRSHPSAPAAVPDEAFNIIEGIRAELTWPGWRPGWLSTRSRDWVVYRISELLSMLTASPAPTKQTKPQEQGKVAGEIAEINGVPIVYWDKSLPVGTKFYTTPPAPAAVPEGWHISRTEGGNIIVQKSHVAGFVASEQSGGIAESTLYYLADDLLAASPAVQGEPVGKVMTVGGYPDESEHTVEWLCKHKDLKDGDLLYTAPQPAPEFDKKLFDSECRESVAGALGLQRGGDYAWSYLLAQIKDAVAAAALLTASPNPDHAADVRKMVAPDVSELEKAAQKLWRESYNCESDFIQAVVDAFSKHEEAER